MKRGDCCDSSNDGAAPRSGGSWCDKPEEANKELGHKSFLEPINVVMRESPATKVTDDILTRFLLLRGRDAQAGMLENPLIREMAEDLYGEHVSRFHCGALKARATLEDIRRSFSYDIQRSKATAETFTSAPPTKPVGAPKGKRLAYSPRSTLAAAGVLNCWRASIGVVIGCEPRNR